MARPLVALAALLTLAVASCGAAPRQSSDRAQCPRLFREYDQIARFVPAGGAERRRGVDALDWRLSQLGLLLVQNDCQTRGRDLAGFEAFAAARTGRRVAEGGAPLGRPVAVHLGAFTDEADAARVQAAFRGFGLQTTGIGAPLLGRRVYAGPVATTDGLDALIDLGREAGFAGVYASEFFRF